ncbi:hypothetical protein [Carboxylicivirga sp. RSCT41]|uniref:hypothetical protein n=1 Tax=Carboxylicivirga agarovorans TaxID=3417570 RepID=UPI003D350399
MNRKYTIKWVGKDIIIKCPGEMDYLSIFSQSGNCLFKGCPPINRILKINQVAETELLIVANVNRALMIDHYKREQPFLVKDLGLYC